MNHFPFPNNESLKNHRGILPMMAFGVVLVGSALLLIIGAGDSSSSGIVLEGAGCQRIEGAEICEIVSDESRVTLRDCSLEDSGCEQSSVELGRREGDIQRALLRSEGGIQMLTVLTIDRDTLEVSEGERYFYTEVAEECRDNRNGYEDECFAYALSEEQRQDVWESNQAYLEAERRYAR